MTDLCACVCVCVCVCGAVNMEQYIGRVMDPLNPEVHSQGKNSSCLHETGTKFSLVRVCVMGVVFRVDPL